MAAVSPEDHLEIGGRMLPFDSGTVSRAKSAVPLRHELPTDGVIDRIEGQYRTRGMRAVFRLANEACFDALRRELGARGYTAGKPVLVEVAQVKSMRGVSVQALAETASAPDEAWAALFLAEGFDPVDGASRVRSLGRGRDSVFASVREGGKAIAAGAAAFSHGWSSVHGMRTDPAHRGKGLAGRVLAAMAEVAMQRGIECAFLQVEEGNAAARALYRRAGFETVWSYDYWTQA